MPKREVRKTPPEIICEPRISRKNQITIPARVLRELQLHPGDQLQLVADEGGSFRLVPKRNVPDFRALIGAVPMKYESTDELLDDLRGEAGNQ